MATAKAAYEELQKAYTRTATVFYALLGQLNAIHFDD